MRDTKLPF